MSGYFDTDWKKMAAMTATSDSDIEKAFADQAAGFVENKLPDLMKGDYQIGFEVVKKKLGPAFVPEMLGAGVVLTGGTSKLMAVDEAATAVFGVAARRGELPTNLADELRDPQYSTVLGLLFYGLNQINDRAPAAYQRRNGGLMQRFTRMFANA